MTVQTQPQDRDDLGAAALQGLLPVRGSGWLSGFGNMLAKEMGEWFHTRRWLWQTITWLILLNGFAVFFLYIMPWLASLSKEFDQIYQSILAGQPPVVMAMALYFSIKVTAGSIGAVILAQDEIIQEKQTGTAAWILSKPASRPAFILTKLLSNFTGALIFIIALTGVVFWLQVYLATGVALPLLPYLAGEGVVLLVLVFYFSLVILLGVVFEVRGPVVGISFGVMFGGLMLANMIPYIGYVVPVWMDKTASLVAQGIPLPAFLISELTATVVLSLLFIVGALWSFQRKEF